ncbi:MAG: GNAT family N-acetyltransferase [Anaerolineales bacterium]|nr:GNAT family N-acetyltransferase [Anaerolineales bacterium]
MDIGDYHQVIALWDSTPGIGLSGADSKTGISQFLNRNPGQNFVVCEGERIVGAVLCGNDGRRGYIHHLVVHSAHRGLGLGRALVARCLEALASAGIQKCHLFVYKDNLEGIAFWKEIGWTERVELQMMSKELG